MGKVMCVIDYNGAVEPSVKDKMSSIPETSLPAGLARETIVVITLIHLKTIYYKVYT